jgi:Amino acid permease
VEDPPEPTLPRSRQLAPERQPSASGPTVPESLGYKLKNRVLGPPLVSEQLTQERLATPVAIGVLAPDMISSSAYGTEEMLLIMVPIIGVGAFTMVIPITLAILAVMLLVMSSYMQVIGVYTRNGGSYVVARDNFGPRVAQVAAVALLIDYTVTVAVQTSAGTAALTSAIPSLIPYTVAITVGVTLLMLFGNLRGIREAGSIFAIPTYFYVVSLSLVGFAGALSLAVVLILLVTKFFEGAWIVAVVGPPMYFGLLRLHGQYVEEERQLETGASAAAEAPVLQRHVVVVVVGRLDMATARAVQYARTLRPDRLRFVHFNIDAAATETLKDEWSKRGMAHFALDIIECEDRRLERAALEYVTDIVADGKTECTVLLPRRAFQSRFQRALQNRTEERIADAVGTVPHVAATIAPFDVEASPPRRFRRSAAGPQTTRREPVRGAEVDRALARRATGTVAINQVAFRKRVRVGGRIRSLRVQTAKGTTNLECEITDDTGNLLLVFQGRPKIPGIEPGARLIVEGIVGSWSRRLAILNPDYELVSE